MPKARARRKGCGIDNSLPAYSDPEKLMLLPPFPFNTPQTPRPRSHEQSSINGQPHPNLTRWRPAGSDNQIEHVGPT